MTQIEEKTSLLISALIDKTQLRDIVWTKTALSTQYMARFSDNLVLVRRWAGFAPMPNDVCSLSIRYKSGKTVEIARLRLGEKGHTQLLQLLNLIAAQLTERDIEEGVDTLLQELESR